MKTRILFLLLGFEINFRKCFLLARYHAVVQYVKIVMEPEHLYVCWKVWLSYV
jgi:hypothetical protein